MKRLFALIAVFGLSACAVIGPSSIESGRSSYNEAVEMTSRQQLLMNIVRVSKNEPPLFLDVNEIDAAVQLQATATGAVTNIGARPGTSGGTLAGRVGSFGAGVQYDESPTVRYQPLQGAALIAQISSPITVDTLAQLYNSDWPLGSILAFAVDRITPNVADNRAALNSIMQLDNCSAITFAAAKSELSEKSPGLSDLAKVRGTPITIQTQPQSVAGNNALDIYFLPNKSECFVPISTAQSNGKVSGTTQQVWDRLFRLYAGTQFKSGAKKLDDPKENPNWLELRSAPLKLSEAANTNKTDRHDNALAPVINTRSAIGILNRLTTGFGSRRLQYVDQQQYEKIISSYVNNLTYFHRCNDEFFYTLRPQLAEELGVEFISDPAERQKISSFIDATVNEQHEKKQHCLYAINPTGGSESDMKLEADLDKLRRFILIVTSPTVPPAGTYTSWQAEDGMWYYINSEDTISQKNFLLLAQFMLIQATQTPSPSLTSVSVGPH